MQKEPQFSLSIKHEDEILKKSDLHASKACQDSDNLSKIITKNAEIFTVVPHSNFSR